MSAERLLHILRLLQSKEKLTTKQLADITQVSERTILRDMDTLTLAGIPVVSERGKYGGWKLMEHFQDELGQLQLDALKGLFILPSDNILQALDIDASSTTLRQSLLTKLPARARRDAQQYFSKIHIDSSTWRATNATNPKVLKQLQAALWEDKKLKIVYKKAGGECSERTICPLGLVAKGSTWYVVAVNEQEQYRSFKVSRIEQIEALKESFSRPPTFQLSQYWEESKNEFIETLPIIQATVLAHRSILPRLSFRQQFVHQVQVIEQAENADSNYAPNSNLNCNYEHNQDSKFNDQDSKFNDHDSKFKEQDSKFNEDGMVTIALQFNSEQEIVEYVLGFGDKMRLLQPEHLITQLVDHVKSVIKLYE